MRPSASVLLPLVAVFFLSPAPVFSDTLSTKQLSLFEDGLHVSWILVTDINPQAPKVTWQGAQNWATSLNSMNYLGYNDWHLPMTPDGTWGYDESDNTSKYDVKDSDFGKLYYNYLGLEKDAGIKTATDPFCKQLKADYYWFGNLSSLGGGDSTVLGYGWIFDFKHGTQIRATTNTLAYTIAIRKTTPTPEPASALLFIAGITALSLMRRR